MTFAFVFVPDGTILIAFFNVLGSVHDSQVSEWGGIYDKLKSVCKSNGGIRIVTLALGRIDHKFLIKSPQDCLCSNKTNFFSAKKDIQTKRATTSMRLAAEWEM